MTSVRLISCIFVLLLAILSLAQDAVIRPGDVVRIACEEDAGLSKDYTVTRDGYIIMQYVGAQAIAGLKPNMAASKIRASLLRERVLDRATITLDIVGAARKAITFGGAVRFSGEMPFHKGARLSDVVSTAKPTEAADLEHVAISTDDGKQLEIDYAPGLDSKSNPLLKAGDRIFFPVVKVARRVSVLGQVNKPGEVAFEKGMTLQRAISSVGGVLAHGDETAVQVRRNNQNTQLNLSRDGSFELKPGDVVQVPKVAQPLYATVSGAVGKPGSVAIKPGMTLTKVIDLAGGLKANANIQQIKVTHVIDGRMRTEKVNLLAMQKGKAPKVVMVGNDSIDVPATNKKNRDMGVYVLGGLVFFLSGIFGK